MKQIETPYQTIYMSGANELQVESAVSEIEPGLIHIQVTFQSEVERHFPQLELYWKHPMVDIQSYWQPAAFHNKSLIPDFNHRITSKAAVSAPVGCFYNLNGQNRLTYALSDALNQAEFTMGVHEEDATLNCRVRLLTEPTRPRTSYQIVLRIDTRSIPYYESIRLVSGWWERMEGYKPAPVPAAARAPMYSTWYSFHQQITAQDIEDQCRSARELGIEAVIVDDGWQTSDSNRGYAYCGDWQVCPDRIPDMRAHVESIHNLGLKYILWYSVPFVGIHSQAWPRFKDKLLSFKENIGAGVLDLRYTECREYLISIYERAVMEWGLDGFKLDFVDEFYLSAEQEAEPRPGMDYVSVQESVDRLLTDVMERLRVIKPDIMIEFRQTYIGPLMRKYGNMFRATDCPNDGLTNRMETLDIRLLSGNTPVHSDMVMWNPQEPVEAAALQLVNILFSVPQFSMRFEALPELHIEMTRFWLTFWREHRDVLLDGELSPRSPEAMYPLVQADAEYKRLIAVYADVVVRTGLKVPNKLILVNGTLQDEIVVSFEEELAERRVRIFDCCGKIVREETASFAKGVQILKIPGPGVALIEDK